MIAADQKLVRVLLIEDMRGMQNALVDLFTTIGGFKVVGTARGESEATAWVEDHVGAWDMATIDLLLEEGTGFNMIRRCRAASPNAHIVVLSDFVTTAVATRCKALGADAVFRKTDARAFATHLTELAKQGLPSPGA